MLSSGTFCSAVPEVMNWRTGFPVFSRMMSGMARVASKMAPAKHASNMNRACLASMLRA